MAINETVEEIVNKVHSGDYGCSKCGDLCDCPNADKIIASIADRILAAHKRELSAEQKRCGKILRDQIAEVERAAEKVAAKDAELAELREYLKDAASLRCGECWFTAHEGKCPHSLDKDCVAITWRKASEGANDE